MDSDAPSTDEMLRAAFAGVDNDDVRLFYEYFDELKGQVRKYLHRIPQAEIGHSDVAQSALISMLCNATLAQVLLSDVDEHGYPALWPLLLAYIERHCNKWKKRWYREQKIKGKVVRLVAGDSGEPTLDPPDYRGPANDEDVVGKLLEDLYAKMTPRQRKVADLSASRRTLEQIAKELDCSESLVSLEKKAIRRLLESL